MTPRAAIAACVAPRPGVLSGQNTRLRFLLFAALLHVTGFDLVAAEGSAYRKEYHKEKNGPRGTCETDWLRLRDGMDYRSVTCLGGDGMDLHVIRLDPVIWKIDSAVTSDGSAAAIARSKGAPFSINANFFDHSRRSLGLVVRDGQQVKAPRASSWQSIFLVKKDGEPRIVTVKKWNDYKSRAEVAVQAGPRLVVDGHTNRVHQSYAAARCGVCIQKSGRLLFFATPAERKFDMYEIARIARRAEEDGGLACRDAMLFDGGHSTQLFVESDARSVVIANDPVPVFLYAKRR